MRDRDQAEMPDDLGSQYLREAEFAIARHATRLNEHPRHAAAIYLRAALSCVRELGYLSRFDPHLLSTAQTLLARLTATARAAEATCFAAGGNSAPYISLLVALEGWRIRLLSLVVQQQHGQPARAAPPIIDQPVPQPLRTASPSTNNISSSLPPRRFVPADQGGRHMKNGHAPERTR